MTITTTNTSIRTEVAPGLRLAHVESGHPNGRPVVLLHGLSDSAHSFASLLPLLPDGRYHVYALDQRGHGDSDRPTSGYMTDELAMDVVAFLDARGIERATLVGRSWGSFAARRVAETAPHRVDRLVLIGSAISPVNDGTRELQQAFQTLEDPVPEEFAREFQLSTIHVPLPEAFLDRAVADSLRVPAAGWQSALDDLLASDTGRIDQITAPTLVLAGQNDAVFSVEQHVALAKAIGARLQVYPETGHAVHWERPHWVARDIDAFLQE